MKSNSPSPEDSAKTNSNLSSLALQVHHLQAMVDFYTEAFGIQFQQVNTAGFLSQFGTFNGLTIKFVPIRESADFENFPSHQLGFTVPDVEHVISLAQKYGGRQEGEIFRDGSRVQAAVRDPDGNSIELYSTNS
jgi:catechol 2,3-dioxygenase-like lactoylglutathione lyase family enzyme